MAEEPLIRAGFVRIKKDGKVLLIQESGSVAYALWSFPGGHIDEHESMEEGAVREGKEETGLEVELGARIFEKEISWDAYRGYSTEKDRQYNLVIFDGVVIGGEVQKDDEALDIGWFTPEEAKKLPLRWPWLKDLV